MTALMYRDQRTPATFGLTDAGDGGVADESGAKNALMIMPCWEHSHVSEREREREKERKREREREREREKQ